MTREGSRTGRHWRGVTPVAIMIAIALMLMPGTLQGALAQDSTSTVDVQTRAVFLHASPSLGETEVSLNWETQLEEFGYGDQSDWVDVPPGAAEVTIHTERRGFNYMVYDAIYPAPAGNDYYMVISDQLVIAGAFDRNPIPDGGARIEIVQASVSLPAVTVVATGTDANWATQLQYPRTSDPSVVPAGTYNLEIRLADSGEVVFTAPNVTLNGDTVNALVIMGNVNDSDHPLELRNLSDSTHPRNGDDSGTPSS